MGIFVPYLRKHGNVSSGGKVQIVHLTISTFTEGQINKRQMISTEYLKDENFHFEPLQLTQKNKGLFIIEQINQIVYVQLNFLSLY